MNGEERRAPQKNASLELLPGPISPVTGLPGAEVMNDALHQAVRQMPGKFAYFEVDLDHASIPNTIDGHPGGDSYIHTAGVVLSDNVRDEDVIGQSTSYRGYIFNEHGDEFSAILLGIESPEQAASITSRLETELLEYGIPATIVCQIHTPGQTARELIEAVDKQLYEEKENRKNKSYDQRQHVLIDFMIAVSEGNGINLRDAAFFQERRAARKYSNLEKTVLLGSDVKLLE